MNPSDYLKSQGWRGEGFSLDSGDRGLAKPILLRHRSDKAGLGDQKRIGSGKDWSEGRQWWLKLYDDTLKGLKSEESSENNATGSVSPSAKPAETSILNSIRLKGNGLYSGFIKADTLSSTFNDSDASEHALEFKMGKGKQEVFESSLGAGETLANPSTNGGSPEKIEKKKSRKSNSELVNNAVLAEEPTSETETSKTKNKKENKKDQRPRDVKDGKRMSTRDTVIAAPQTSVVAEVIDTPQGAAEDDGRKRKHESGQGASAVTGRNKKAKTKDNTTPPPKTKRQLQREAVRAARPQLKAEKFERKVREAAASSGLVANVNLIGSKPKESWKAIEPAELEGPDKLERAPFAAKAEEPSKIVQTRASQVAANKRKVESNTENAEREQEAQEDSVTSTSESESHDSSDSEEETEKTGELRPREEMEEAGEPHPESIAALRAKGVKVDVPGDRTDKDTVRYQMIHALETGKGDRIDRIWNNALAWVKSHHPQEPNGVVAAAFSQKKLSNKGDKYLREKAKRVAKRDARKWVTARANPGQYRPDGTHVSKPALRSEERLAAKAVKIDEGLQNEAQKEAKISVKQQMKIERRKARQMRRAEKKTANHIKQQKQMGLNNQLKKREKDEEAAAAKGMTYDDFVAEREKNLAEKRRIRENKRAKELGMTFEQYQAKKTKDMSEKEMQKEARKLGMTFEEYANRPADLDKVQVLGEVGPGLKDGTGDTHGRSPIDVLWARHHQALQIVGNGDAPAQTTTASTAVEVKTNGTSNIGDDFIPLTTDPSTSANAALFTVDTEGDANISSTKKRVKDMTKEERKARLEAMRAKRAEKAARKGETQPKMSKKQRRKARLQRKEEVIQRMATDILNKKREKLEEAGGDTPQSGPVSKAARKQATRDARKIARGLKKGKIREEDVPEGWRMPGKKKKPKFMNP